MGTACYETVQVGVGGGGHNGLNELDGSMVVFQIGTIRFSSLSPPPHQLSLFEFQMVECAIYHGSHCDVHSTGSQIEHGLDIIVIFTVHVDR